MQREGKPYRRPPTKKRKSDTAVESISNGKAGYSTQEEETGSRPSSPVQARTSPFGIFGMSTLNMEKQADLWLCPWSLKIEILSKFATTAKSLLVVTRMSCKTLELYFEGRMV